VGYGVTAPDQKHDDYAGADVRGRIVAYFSGAPSRFPDTIRAHYSSSLLKLENAAKHGAAGVIVLNTRADGERYPWPKALRQFKLGAMHWLESDGRPHAVREDVSSTITMSTRGAEQLVSNSGRTFDQIIADLQSGTLPPLDLRTRVTMHLISAHDEVESPNVVGVLRGSDPKLRDQYLVYSSHLDHLGISEPVNGDSINNGALDNASGIGVMIEIAKAFASEKPPRRSIIFLATTGEEKGLRGADYFANNPTVPIDQLVANINIDEVLMLTAVRDIVPLGIEASDLGVMARKVARDMKLDISPDPYPEEVIFIRSDQYPFVRRGVPAIYVSLGYTPAVKGGPDPIKQQLEWFRTTYHTPQDDMSQSLDYAMAVMLARFNYLLGSEVTNRTAAPAWTPGNFFGQTFGRGGQAPSPVR
jgi:Zn-dependent M28 family amino/carboxypeptidase